MSKADNKVRPLFRHNPATVDKACRVVAGGTGRIFPIAVSFVAKIRPVFVTPHSLLSEENPLPSLTPYQFIRGSI